MANEIHVFLKLTATKGSLSVAPPQLNTTFTLSAAAPNVAGVTQAIGFAAHEVVTVGDVATLGWAWFKNTDATNFVQIGLDVGATFYPLVRLNAGEAGCFRLAQGITVYAKADAAAVVLEKYILDN